MNPRVHEEAQVKTVRGGVLSLAAVALTGALLATALWRWLVDNPRGTVERLAVDTELSRVLPISLQMTFHALSCADVELTALEASGQIHLDMAGEVSKTRLDAAGRVLGGETDSKALAVAASRKAQLACGSCYGAENAPGDCCRTCHDVKVRYAAKGWDAFKVVREAEQCLREMSHPEIALQAGEGCRVRAQLAINKVAGSLHVALGTTRKVAGQQLLHTFQLDKMGEFDTSHTIDRLVFGVDDGSAQALDGVSVMVNHTQGQTAAIQHFVHLIPTKRPNGEVSYRYSHALQYVPILDPVPDKEHTTDADEGARKTQAQPNLQHISVLPGAYLAYDFSPFMHVVEPKFFTLTDLLVDMLALGGGIVATVRLVDSAAHLLGL